MAAAATLPYRQPHNLSPSSRSSDSPHSRTLDGPSRVYQAGPQRRPLSPGSLRDLDLSEMGSPRARDFPPPPTGHDLMALFPPPAPTSLPESRPPSTSNYFVLEERAYFARTGRDTLRTYRPEPMDIDRPSPNGTPSAPPPPSLQQQLQRGQDTTPPPPSSGSSSSKRSSSKSRAQQQQPMSMVPHNIPRAWNAPPQGPGAPQLGPPPPQGQQQGPPHGYAPYPPQRARAHHGRTPSTGFPGSPPQPYPPPSHGGAPPPPQPAGRHHHHHSASGGAVHPGMMHPAEVDELDQNDPDQAWASAQARKAQPGPGGVHHHHHLLHHGHHAERRRAGKHTKRVIVK